MADFRFSIDINANYETVKDAKKEMTKLRSEIGYVTSPKNNINMDAKEIKQAETYVEALNNTIKKLDGNDTARVGSKVAEEFRRIGGEADRAEDEVERLNRQLEKARAAGAGGAGGIAKVSTAAKLATQDIKRTTTQLDKLQNNLREGIGQTVAFGGITAFTGAVGSALNEVAKLDKVMTDISIVSGKAASEMESYRDAAFKSASTLGTTAKDYMEASLIYEQQGGEAAGYATELAKATTIAANVTGQSAADMSEYLTATINGFEMFGKKGAEAGMHVVDVFSNLGAKSGSGLEEMAEALKRTATVAKNAGYEFEDISSAIATVSETTRRSPEVIGSAFKSILLSFQQLREGTEDDLNAFTNKVEKAFDLSGIKSISIFDDNGRLREAEGIMKDIGREWGTMSKEGQALLSEAIAGKEQAETLQAFLDNQGRYNELLETAYNSAGVAANQQLVYMESLEAHMNSFKNSWQAASSAMIDSDLFKGVLDQATDFLNVIGAQENGIMAIGTAIAPLAGAFGQLFGGKMMEDARRNAENATLGDRIQKNLESRLATGEELSDQLKEQVETAKEEQRIMQSLGEKASEIYKKNKEEARELNDELERSQRLQDNPAAAIDKVRNDFAVTGGSKDVNLSEVKAAGTAGVEEVRATIAEYRKEAEQLADDIAEIAYKTADIATDPLRGSLDDGIEDVATMKARINEMTESLKSSEIQAAEFEDVIKLGERAVNSTTMSYEELESVLHGIPSQIEQIGNEQRKVAEESEEVLLNQRRLEAENAEIINQLGARNRSTSEIQEEIDLTRAQNEELENGARRTKNWRIATETLSGAFGAGMPIIASYKAVMEGTITAGDAMEQGLMGIGTTLMMIPHPLAKVAGLLAVLGGSFIDFRSEAQKVQETNEEIIRNFMSLSESTTGAVSAIADIKNAYSTLAGEDALAMLNSSDEDLANKYKEVAEVIASTSPELVKYYNNEGVAIVDLSNSYKELLDSKNEAVAEANQTMFSNSDNFISQYSAEMKAAANDSAEATIKLKKAQDSLKTDGGSGPDNAEALSNIQKYNFEIQSANEKIKETKAAIQTNVIHPMIQANKQVALIPEKFSEMADKIKSQMADLASSANVGDLISGGDEEGAKKILDTISEIGSGLAQLKPDEVEKFTDQLDKLSALDKNLLLNSGKSFKEINKDIKEGRAGLKDYVLTVEELNAQSRNLEIKEELEDVNEAISDTQKEANRLDLVSAYASGTDAAKDLGKAQDKTRKKLESLRRTQRNLNKEFSKTEKASKKVTKSYEDVKEAASEASKTPEGFNSTLKQYNKLEDTVKDGKKSLDKFYKTIEQQGGKEVKLDAGGVEKLNESLPETLQGVIEVGDTGAEATQKINDNFDYMDYITNAVFEGMAMQSTDFYDEWKQKNADTINSVAENYGIDAANYSNLSQYKEALNSVSVAEFARVEKAKMDESKRSNEAQSNWSNITATNLLGSFNYILDGFDAFSSDSLTISDKIKYGLLLVVDAVTGALAAIPNAFVDMWNDMAKTAETMVNSIIKILKKIGISDFDEVEIADAVALEGIAGTTFARDYQDKAQKKNEEAKKRALEQLDANKGGVLEDYEAGGGFKPQKAPTLDQLETEKGTSTPDPKRDTPPTKAELDAKRKKKKKEKDKKKKKEKKKKEDVDDLDLELDRYYKLDHQLSSLENHLDNVGRKKNEAFGSSKIKLMDAESRSYAQQTKVMEKYINALKREQIEIKRRLSSSGFKFDGAGEISNLNRQLSSLEKKANSQKGKAKEKAIEQVKKVQEEAERYGDITFNLIPDKKNAIAEAKSTLKEIAREKVEYKVELRVNKNDLLTNVKDTMKEINGTDFSKLDENMVISGSQIKDNVNMVKYYQDQIRSVQGNKSLSSSDRNELVQEYKEAMLDAAKGAKAAYDELGEAQSEFISQASEMSEIINEAFSSVADRADSIANMYDEVYGTKAFQDVSKMRDIQLKALDEQMYANSKNMEAMLAYRDSLKKGTEAWKEANEVVETLGQSIEESLIQKVEILNQKFQDFMEGLLTESDKSIFGSLGLEDFEEQMERALASNEKFMNSFEKITKIGGLMSEVSQSMKDTDDPAAAAAYQKFKEKELQTLMASDQVSEAQFERAKLLWEIELKRQALEDRKNAKRTAQLVRDESGNMSYEYVAEKTEKSSGAQKDYTDAKNDLKDFDDQQVKDSSNKILEVIKNTNDKIQEIYSNNSLTEAEKKDMLARTQKQAQEDIAEAQKEMLLWSGNSMKDGIEALKNSFQNNKVSFEGVGVDDETISKLFASMDNGSLSIQDMLKGDVDSFVEATGVSVEEATKAINAVMNMTNQENTTLIQSMLELSNKWITTTDKNLDTLEKEYKKTQKNIKNTTDVLANSTKGLTKEIDKNSKAAEKNTKKIKDQQKQMVAANKVAGQSKVAFDKLTASLVGKSGGGGTLGAMANLKKEMEKKLQVALRVTTSKTKTFGAAANVTSKQLKTMGDKSNYSFKQTKQFDSETIRKSNSNISKMSKNAKSAGTNVENLGKKATKSRASIASLSVALAALPGLDTGKKHYYTKTNKDGSITNVSYAKKPKNTSGMQYIGYFAKGGYTGEWKGSSGNQEGRPAIVHEKEWILNKDDTKNFLEGMQIQRKLLNQNPTSGMAELMAKAGSAVPQSGMKQQVQINANFPAATNSKEIESALNSLSLKAQSYAFNKGNRP